MISEILDARGGFHYDLQKQKALRDSVKFPVVDSGIGAKCSHGIVLIADTKITRVNDEKLESTIKKR